MFLAIRRSVLLFAVLAAACTDNTTHTTLPSAETAEVSQAKMGTNPPGQVREIEALLSSWKAAWDANDAAAFAAHYAEDADFINPLGGILSGRDAIRTQHVILFSGPFRGSVQGQQLRRLVFLTGTTAIVDLDLRLTGFVGLPPGLPQFEPGVVFTRGRLVVLKHRGSWEIAAQQLTAVQPLP
jgi:uncharacterized protein (TIGR02246 family)